MKDLIFSAVQIGIERHCPATLDFCLEWTRADRCSRDLLISTDLEGETILHAGTLTDVFDVDPRLIIP